VPETELNEKPTIICPKCRREIDHLIGYEQTWMEFNFFTGVKTISALDVTGEFFPTEEYKFNCPECYEILYTDVEKAVNFLNP